MSIGTMFPVGHYCGTSLHNSRPASDQTASAKAVPAKAAPAEDDHLVRVGHSLERLTDDEFGIWILTHGIADVGKGDWTTHDILERATDAEISNPAGCVDELLDRGLLAFVPTQPERADESVAFAAAYRVDPLLVGLGTMPEGHDQHAIGIPGVGTAALLDADCYQLWWESALAPTLWQLCQERVARGARSGTVGSGLDGLVDPARLLADLLGELRVLIVHGCAYLDVVPNGELDENAPPAAPDEPGETGNTDPGNVAG